MKNFIKTYYLVFGLIATLHSAALGQTHLSYAIDGKIYLKTKEGVTADLRFANGRFFGDSLGIKSLFTQYGVTAATKPFEQFSSLNPKFNSIYELNFTDINSATLFTGALEALPSVEYAELVPIFQALIPSGTFPFIPAAQITIPVSMVSPFCSSTVFPS